jgi:hypothetical protein
LVGLPERQQCPETNANRAGTFGLKIVVSCGHRKKNKRRFMKRLLTAALISACCFGTIQTGQTQDTVLRGPIRLEEAKPTSGPLRPVYTLRFLQVSDTKPTEYVWLLQKTTAPSEGAIEPNETVFRSLNSPILHEFVTHLTPGSRIMHSPIMLPGPDPTQKVGSDSEPGLQDFIKFCRSSKIDFEFGIAF